MRHRIAFATLLSASALLCPVPSHALGIASVAQGTPWAVRGIRLSRRIVARPGETVRAASFFALARDCSQNGWPEMQIRFAPVAGRVWDQRGTGSPGYPKRNVRHLCNGTDRPADVVYYRAPEGFKGLDHFTVWEIFPDGRGALKSIDVDVR